MNKKLMFAVLAGLLVAESAMAKEIYLKELDLRGIPDDFTVELWNSYTPASRAEPYTAGDSYSFPVSRLPDGSPNPGAWPLHSAATGYFIKLTIKRNIPGQGKVVVDEVALQRGFSSTHKNETQEYAMIRRFGANGAPTNPELFRGLNDKELKVTVKPTAVGENID